MVENVNSLNLKLEYQDILPNCIQILDENKGNDTAAFIENGVVTIIGFLAKGNHDIFKLFKIADERYCPRYFAYGNVQRTQSSQDFGKVGLFSINSNGENDIWIKGSLDAVVYFYVAYSMKRD